MPCGICAPSPPELLGEKVGLCPFNAPTSPTTPSPLPRPAPSHGQPDPQPPFSTVMVQGVPQLSSGLAEHGIFQVGQVWRDLAL